MELAKLPFSLQWLLVGALLGVGFVIPVLWPAGLIGIAIHIALSPSLSGYKLFLGPWFAWTVKSALALVWFWYVYPIEWLAFELGNIQLVLIFLYWITASMWLGSGGVIASVLIRYFLQSISQKGFQCIAVAVSWGIAEILGSYIFSIITIGEGGSVTSAFSFGFAGYLFANHTFFLFAALVAGVYSLGFLVVCVSYFLYSYRDYLRNNLILSTLVFGSVYVCGYFPLVQSEIPENGYQVAVVNTEFPPNQIRSIEGAQMVRNKQIDAFGAALSSNPDYLLWPEDARALTFPETQALHVASNTNTVVIDSLRVDTGDHTYLEARLYQPGEQDFMYSHKRYLVPQGEFMPSLYIGTLKLFGYDALVARVARDVSYEVGPKISQSDFHQQNPGVLFCFESVSPYGVMSLLSERTRPPFIAHPISHSWFHTPEILWYNLNAMLKVQAVWSRMYIVSAGSHAVGAVYTPYGEVKSMHTIAEGDGWTVNTTVIPYE